MRYERVAEAYRDLEAASAACSTAGSRTCFWPSPPWGAHTAEREPVRTSEPLVQQPLGGESAYPDIPPPPIHRRREKLHLVDQLVPFSVLREQK